MLHRAIGNTTKYLENSYARRKLDKDGNDVTAIHKFITDLYYSTKEFHGNDTEIYLVWDRKIFPDSVNWRTKINPLYKANRPDKEDNEQKKQVHLLCKHIKKIADVLGFHSVFPLVSEGDDIINYLKKILDGDSVIVSADQDFYQCVSEDCCVYNPQKKFTLTVNNFEKHVPVSLENYVLWKSIKGDSSDNIKGLYRYGDVKAKKLVENWDEESKKLTEEQHEIIKETVSIIDLNFKDLSKNEKIIIGKQIIPKEISSDAARASMLESYGVSYATQELWDDYFVMKELF